MKMLRLTVKTNYFKMKQMIFQAYLLYMKDVAKLLGADEIETEKQMFEALQFEINMANISLPRY